MKQSAWFRLDSMFRKREFANLMSLYEKNYQRLGELAPVLCAPRAERQGLKPGPLAISEVEQAPDLHLEVLETHPYTTEIRLTHFLPTGEGGGEIANPDLRVRLYHDTGQAEMMCDVVCEDLMNVLEQEDEDPTSLERRWTTNIFLYRWLSYCLHHGHGFHDDDELQRSLAGAAV